MNMMKKCFLILKMDECRNAMLHQILSDRHPGTFSESKKKGAGSNSDPSLFEASTLSYNILLS